MFPSSSALPQDVYDNVIDHLRDDKPTLKACSLVTSAWSRTSHKHLHRTMVFCTSLPSPEPTDNVQPVLHRAPRPANTDLLLGISSHLLLYARSIIIRGELLESWGGCICYTSKPPKTRAPDPSLVILLENIHMLALPSLVSVELRDLVWTGLEADLQHALISLLSGGIIQHVKLAGCDIPVSVPWLRFVGPQTRSLKLREVAIITVDDPSAKHETSIGDLPLPLGPKLINLEVGSLFPSETIKWILHPPKDTADSNDSLSLKTTTPSRSWRDSLSILSIYWPLSMDGLFEMFQACTHLTTLRMILQEEDGDISPLSELLRIPMLEHLHIILISSDEFHVLISSFEEINANSPSSTLHCMIPITLGVTKSKTILVNMSDDMHLQTPMDMPALLEFLEEIKALDNVVARFSYLEVGLTMKSSMLRLKDRFGTIEYEQAMLLLGRLQAGLKALKLEVDHTYQICQS
ncbi:hypothetical protein ONZ45_g2546 [Pleurotus djamor]|nr:hypothetical protein ONZ45_g2546 [Pleurotus djamor]